MDSRYTVTLTATIPPEEVQAIADTVAATLRSDSDKIAALLRRGNTLTGGLEHSKAERIAAAFRAAGVPVSVNPVRVNPVSVPPVSSPVTPSSLAPTLAMAAAPALGATAAPAAVVPVGRYGRPGNVANSTPLTGLESLPPREARDFVDSIPEAPVRTDAAIVTPLALGGALLLFIGAFAPLLSVLGESINLREYSSNGNLLLVVALVSVGLTLTRNYGALRIAGFVALGLVGTTMRGVQRALRSFRSSAGMEAYGELAAHISLGWAWLPLFAGAAALIGAAYLAKRSEKSPH